MDLNDGVISSIFRHMNRIQRLREHRRFVRHILDLDSDWRGPETFVNGTVGRRDYERVFLEQQQTFYVTHTLSSSIGLCYRRQIGIKLLLMSVTLGKFIKRLYVCIYVITDLSVFIVQFSLGADHSRSVIDTEGEVSW